MLGALAAARVRVALFAAAIAVGLAPAACGPRSQAAIDASANPSPDARAADASGAAPDARSGAATDAAGPIDARTGATADGAAPIDAATAAAADAAAPAPDAATPPPGLSIPCDHGPGWALFRFGYDPSAGLNPVIDVWDATCDYSYAPESICRIDAIGGVDSAAGGQAIALDGSDYLRVRFSVTGLDFSTAAVYIQARSLSTTASTDFEVWSPLYGSVYGGPVDNDFVYDWYGVDWTGYLYPGDEPGLTAIQIYPYTGSGSLGIASVELCVE